MKRLELIGLLLFLFTYASAQNAFDLTGTWDIEITGTQASPFFGQRTAQITDTQIHFTRYQDNIYKSDRCNLTFVQLGETNVFKVYWTGVNNEFADGNVGAALLNRVYLENKCSMHFTMLLTYRQGSLIYHGQGDWVKTYIEFSMIKIG